MMSLILSIGIWLGISSLFYSLCLFFLDAIPRGFFILDLLLLGICIFLVPSHLKKLDAREVHLNIQPKASRILTMSFYTLLILNVLSFIFQSMREPHGGWDGWGIWNMHARFLFRGGEHWQDLFSPFLNWNLLDYPWLIPATVARFWNYLGNETPIIPILVSFFFTFGTVGLLFFGLYKMRNKNQALMAGIVLLGTPLFITSGCSQGADTPIGFFILSTLLLFSLLDELKPDNQKLIILAGLTAGLAGWTKNEGILFLLSILVARTIVKIWLKVGKKPSKELFLFTVGSLPALLVIFYFKTLLAPANYLMSDKNLSTVLHKLTDFSRTHQILSSFYHQLGNHDWNWFPLFLIFYALIVGIKIEKNSRTYLATSFITLLIMLAGYFFVYLFTPMDLSWHLENSLNRLLLQLWPAFLFTYFLLIPVPGYFLKSPRKGPQYEMQNLR